jgi:hypothetical protein
VQSVSQNDLLFFSLILSLLMLRYFSINLKQQYSNGTKTIHLDHHSIEKFLEVTEVEID